jgi:hypothetical protein
MVPRHAPGPHDGPTVAVAAAPTREPLARELPPRAPVEQGAVVGRRRWLGTCRGLGEVGRARSGGRRRCREGHPRPHGRGAIPLAHGVVGPLHPGVPQQGRGGPQGQDLHPHLDRPPGCAGGGAARGRVVTPQRPPAWTRCRQAATPGGAMARQVALRRGRPPTASSARMRPRASAAVGYAGAVRKRRRRGAGPRAWAPRWACVVGSRGKRLWGAGGQAGGAAGGARGGGRCQAARAR